MTSPKNAVNDEEFWKNYLEQKVQTSTIWREFWAPIQKKLKDKDFSYEEVSKRIEKKCQKLHRSWRKGLYKEARREQDGILHNIVSMSDKFVLVVTECRDKNTTFRLLGRKSLDEKWTGRLLGKDGEDWTFNCVAVNEQVSVFGGDGIIRVIDNKKKKEVKQLKGPSKPVTHLCFGQNGYLVALFHLASSATVESYHLKVWQVKSPTDISLVGTKTVEGSIMRVCVVKDLVVLICRPFADWRKKNRLVKVTVDFLSITTLDSVRNLSALGSSIATEVGDALITVMPEGCIRVADFNSGMPMRTIKCKPWETMPRVRMNSKYIVTAENIDDDSKVAIRIYDLEAVMNPFADVDTLLLKTFKVKNIEIYDMLVDEMHIILNGFYKKIEDGDIKENVTAIVRLNFNSTLMNSGRDHVYRFYGRMKCRLLRPVRFTFK